MTDDAKQPEVRQGRIASNAVEPATIRELSAEELAAIGVQRQMMKHWLDAGKQIEWENRWCRWSYWKFKFGELFGGKHHERK